MRMAFVITRDHRGGRVGFTLVEIMVAMAVGMVLLNAAFALLSQTQKFIRRIEKTGLRSEIMQGQIMWVLSGGGADYPAGLQSGMTGGHSKIVASARLVAAAAKSYKQVLSGAAMNVQSNIEHAAVIYVPEVY